MSIKLPNFLIVGAAKSGTSSLHNYLNQHPDIFLPSFDDNGKKVLAHTLNGSSLALPRIVACILESPFKK